MGRRMSGHVVAGVDGSATSIRALDLAAAEAALHGFVLRVVHVREPDNVWPIVGSRSAATIDAERVIWNACRRAAHRHPGLHVDEFIRDGLVVPVLVEESGTASMTVIGHRGSGGFLGSAAGSVCTQLLARAHGPVIVTRGTASIDTQSPVVLGVDAIAPAPAAIGFAYAEASRRGVALHMVYAWSHQRVAVGFAPPVYGFADDRDQAARLLSEATAGWSQLYPDVKVETVVEHSLDPPAAMRRAAREAGLVVVGPPDQSAAHGLLSGSVATALTNHARCPVAVVHRR